MLKRFSRAYPLLSILFWSGLFSLGYLAYRWYAPDGHVLTVLTGTAFLLYGTFSAFLLLNALYVERAVRRDAPLWRARFAIAWALWWFLSQIIVLGIELPSAEAVVQLGAGLFSGALLANLSRHDEVEVGDGAFNLKRPIWATRTGKLVSTYAGFAVFGHALLVALLAPGTAIGIFFVALLFPVMMPLVLKSRTRWRERELVLGVIVAAGVILGLFAQG